MPIRLIRLSRFINEVVGKRKLPSGADKKLLGKPSVIMKLDIEGTGSKKKKSKKFGIKKPFFYFSNR